MIPTRTTTQTTENQPLFSWEEMVQQAAAKPLSPLEINSKKAVKAMQKQATSMESMQEAAIVRETQLLQDNQVLTTQLTQLHALLAAERATAQKLIADQQKELELANKRLEEANQTVTHVKKAFTNACQDLNWHSGDSYSIERFARGIDHNRAAVLRKNLENLHNYLKEE